MKRSLLTLAALLVCFAAGAQAIGQAELNEIRGSFVKDASTKVDPNIIQNGLIFLSNKTPMRKPEHIAGTI